MSRERQLSLVAIGVGKTDMQVLLNLFCRQMLEPFDRAYPVRKEIVREIQLLQLPPTLYAIEVDVIKRQPPAIFIDQSKRGTSDPCPFADFQPFRHPPHKTGFSPPPPPRLPPKLLPLYKTPPLSFPPPAQNGFPRSPAPG